MEVGDTQLAQVVDAVLHAAQGAGEALGVGGVSDAARVLGPGGVEGAGQVQAAQLVVALRIGPGGQGEQVEGLLLSGVAVEGGEPVEKVGVPGLGAREKDVPLDRLKRVQDVEDDVVKGWREGPTTDGDIARGRGRVIPGGSIRRRRGPESCPRTRDTSPADREGPDRAECPRPQKQPQGRSRSRPERAGVSGFDGVVGLAVGQDLADLDLIGEGLMHERHVRHV